MRAVYLIGEQLHIRAMIAGDAQHAAAWFDSPFPVNASRAETWLKDEHKAIWDHPRHHYAVVQNADDAVIGGVMLNTDFRRGLLRIQIAPSLPHADALRAETLKILYPWLRDDLELMTFVIHIPEDQSVTCTAAEELGMILGVRFRQGIARGGYRVDELIYQALFRPWTVRDA